MGSTTVSTSERLTSVRLTPITFTLSGTKRLHSWDKPTTRAPHSRVAISILISNKGKKQKGGGLMSPPPTDCEVPQLINPCNKAKIIIIRFAY